MHLLTRADGSSRMQETISSGCSWMQLRMTGSESVRLYCEIVASFETQGNTAGGCEAIMDVKD